MNKIYIQILDIIEKSLIDNNRSYSVSLQDAYDYFEIKKNPTSKNEEHLPNKKQLEFSILKSYLKTGKKEMFFSTNMICLLTDVLESTDLSIQEIANILFSMIEEIPKVYERKKDIDIFKIILEYYPSIISDEMVKSYVAGDEKEIRDFIKKDSRLQDALNSELFILDIDNICEQIRSIQKSYANIKRKNNPKYIFEAINGLLRLGVNPAMLYVLEDELVRDYYKKEYHQYLEIINKYFNLDTDETILLKISKEEREQVVIAMIIINTKKESVIKFLKETDDQQKEKYDYEEEYNFYYEKMLANTVACINGSTTFKERDQEKKTKKNLLVQY